MNFTPKFSPSFPPRVPETHREGRSIARRRGVEQKLDETKSALRELGLNDDCFGHNGRSTIDVEG